MKATLEDVVTTLCDNFHRNLYPCKCRNAALKPVNCKYFIQTRKVLVK